MHRFIVFVSISVSVLVVAGFGQSATPRSVHAAACVSAPTVTGVLVLGPTVSGGAASLEATTAVAQGFCVDIVPDFVGISQNSGGPTGYGFRSYRAIILGDPDCSLNSSPPSEAVSTAGVWGPASNGNVVIVGTDPVHHRTAGATGNGGTQVTYSGIAFATADATKTGAYITLSCYYWNNQAGSNIIVGEPMLAGLGAFNVQGISGCFQTVRKVANHPALNSLTSADLSVWGCSVHEAFWACPASFTPLAVAEGLGTFVASDGGAPGQPYILARGQGLTPVGPASIKICKQTDPPAGTGFTFVLAFPGSPPPRPAPFPLVDNQCETGSGLSGGLYSAAELSPLPAGWQLANIVCTGGVASTFTFNTGGASSFTTGDTGVTINLLPGQNVTCTFTNFSPPDIAVGGIVGLPAGRTAPSAPDSGSAPGDYAVFALAAAVAALPAIVAGAWYARRRFRHRRGHL